jgi:iron complex outermembrane receptor protein
LNLLQYSYYQQDTFSLTEVITSSSLIGIPVSAVPNEIQIITSDQIKASTASSLDEILESVASVDVRSCNAMGAKRDIILCGG